MMVAAQVNQETKGHTQGWRGHRMEGLYMPLPTAVETSTLALRHTLWMVTGDRTKSVSGSICPSSNTAVLADTLRRGKARPRPTLSHPSPPPHLGFPLHPSQRDGQQHGDSDHTDDTDVVDGVYNGCAILLGGASELSVLSSPVLLQTPLPRLYLGHTIR